ncbi:MAG: hypothetical protein IJG40_12930 [Oscillospiraceae bacterium]|nr:hypothetical protein [Oscillospiraceae bacterium]
MSEAIIVAFITSAVTSTKSSSSSTVKSSSSSSSSTKSNTGSNTGSNAGSYAYPEVQETPYDQKFYPSYREKVSRKAKEHWQDPVYREKNLAARRKCIPR